eukprot:TRINITY_DN1263_c0_g1_i1.p1 TRINITY_DN1263_c0_g1~~TRINITY_DN1263_c0_g1_i1.p1  ORF type:complete len:280 (+),score=84.70 TRINITY_DN1263_c0_g1_i1:73-912(+)
MSSLSAPDVLKDADKYGYLTKQGRVRKNWKKRWFVLVGNKLYYYKNPRALSPIKVIRLTQTTYVSRSSPPENPKPHGFVLRTLNRIFLMCGDTDQESEEWVASISANISKEGANPSKEPDEEKPTSPSPGQNNPPPSTNNSSNNSSPSTNSPAPSQHKQTFSNGTTNRPQNQAASAPLSNSVGGQAAHQVVLKPVPKPEQQTKNPNAEKRKTVGLVTAKAQYDFDPQHDDELMLREGDIITVSEKRDDGWWRGRIGGREGLFPANYVEETKGYGVSYYK